MESVTLSTDLTIKKITGSLKLGAIIGEFMSVRILGYVTLPRRKMYALEFKLYKNPDSP